MSELEKGILIAVVMVISMSVGSVLSTVVLGFVMKWWNNRRHKKRIEELKANKCKCLHCQMERFLLLGETPTEDGNDDKHHLKIIQFNKEKTNDGKPIHGDNA